MWWNGARAKPSARLGRREDGGYVVDWRIPDLAVKLDGNFPMI